MVSSEGESGKYRTCSECRYWHDGVCYRYPPDVFLVENSGLSVPGRRAAAALTIPLRIEGGYRACGEFDAARKPLDR